MMEKIIIVSLNLCFLGPLWISNLENLVCFEDTKLNQDYLKDYVIFFQEDPNDIDPKRKELRGNDGEDKAQSVETLPPGIAVRFVMKDP